jgi:hypothetical protein
MPMVELKTSKGAREASWQFWDGGKFRSSREFSLALDMETEPITDERVIPRLALATASDDKTHVIIHPDRLGEFLLLHRDAYFVGHNVQFDFWVIDHFLKGRSDQQAGRVLWDACDQGRLLDTQILDMLLQLATGKFRKAPKTGRGKGKDDNTKIYPGNLAEVAADYTVLRITKDDPYRLRFGELIGLSEREWAGVAPGFFEYAVRDPIVTRRLYPALAHAAYRLMLEYGFDRSAERYEIRPDALEEFGYLSEVIQVQASIVLAYMFRRGVRVSLDKARELEAKYREELAAIITGLERDYREVLTYGKKDGHLRLTPKGRTPSMGPKKLTPMLLKVVEEVRAAGHDITPPVSKGKKKEMSCGPKEWAEYGHLHPFLRLWVRMEGLSKRLAFLANFSAPVLHGEYNLLVRTGRTSCSAPRSEQLPGLNLQQMPRDPEFRAIFVADPGCKLLTSDSAGAELRTLAAVCRARYGYSRLGDVIAGGGDPHAFTAAAILGMSMDEFLKLKGSDPERYKHYRQAAKGINFGVPGGLGAKALVAYARRNYQVTLTLEEAERFRQQLINEIYPELREYLADTGMPALARNLGVTEREAWEVLDGRGERSPLAARGVAKVVAGTSTASEPYQAGVWDGLCRLLNTVRDADGELVELVAREQGGSRLHDRLYRRSVATLTGRIRAGVSYTESRNTPFQSLCADGAKVGLWKLLYAGFDPYSFIHDEAIVQLPPDGAGEDANKAVALMVGGMEAVMGQGIPAECEKGVADCWAKP